MAAAMGMLLACAAVAAAEPLEIPKLEVHGPYDSTIRLEVFNRIRGEFVDWFAPAPTAAAPNYRYDYLGNKFQLGLRVKRDPWEMFLQFQNSTLAEVPANAVGIGSVYRANTNRSTQNGAILRNAWLGTTRLFGVPGLFVRGGRQLYSDGAEAPARHPTLRWVQANRVAQRLVGPFDFTHIGRSFDGAQAGWDRPGGNLTAFYFRPTYGGFEVDANPELNINLAGLSLSLKDAEGVTSPWLENTAGRLFWIFYGDDRDLVFLDNRALAARQADRGRAASIHTVGANVMHVEEIGPGLADGLAFGFGQTGEWQSLQHRAWAYGVEFGYGLPDVWAAPWLRLGINSASGDQDPNDNIHGTFFQLLPTPWIYAQFPFYNMMNNQDVFAQWILDPDPRLSVRFEGHWLRLNSGNDLQYFGGGATSNTFFGYGGLPSNGRREVAYVAQMYVTVRATSFLSFNALYAHAFGQGVIAANFDGDNGNYGFIEAALSF